MAEVAFVAPGHCISTPGWAQPWRLAPRRVQSPLAVSTLPRLWDKDNLESYHTALPLSLRPMGFLAQRSAAADASQATRPWAWPFGWPLWWNRPVSRPPGPPASAQIYPAGRAR